MTDSISKDEMAKIVQEISDKIEISPVDYKTGRRIANLEMAHYTKPESIVCKWCGSKDIMKYGIREGTQEYICRACRRKLSNNDTPFKKRSTIEDIGTSISSYFDGLSFADIARHLSESGNPVNESTVYRWVMSYAQKAVKAFEDYHPKVSGEWIAKKRDSHKI